MSLAVGNKGFTSNARESRVDDLRMHHPQMAPDVALNKSRGRLAIHYSIRETDFEKCSGSDGA